MSELATSDQATYNIFLLQKLNELLAVFSDEKLDVIVLKGAAFMETLYPDLRSRKISDIDLLFRRKDFQRVQTLLKERGFELMPKSTSTYIKRDPFPVVVDVHDHLRYMDDLDEGTIWQRSREQVIAQTSTRTLSHTHTVLFLIVHMGLSHGYPDAKWLKDIALYLKHYRSDFSWEDFVEQCVRYRFQTLVYFTLGKVSVTHNADIAPAVLEKLRPRNIFSLQAFVFERMLRSGAPSPFVDYCLPLIAEKSGAKRLRMIARLVFPEPDIMCARYQIKYRILVYPYYFIRLFQLGFKALAGFLAIIVR